MLRNGTLERGEIVDNYESVLSGNVAVYDDSVQSISLRKNQFWYAYTQKQKWCGVKQLSEDTSIASSFFASQLEEKKSGYDIWLAASNSCRILKKLSYVPLPSIDEQAEIARRVESLFAKAGKLEAQYKEAMELIESLPEIILSKAFRGELVPQDPNDEPAVKLLERISMTKATETDQLEVKDKRKGEIMKEKKEDQRNVLTILREAGISMTPEEVFAEGSFDEESVDIFYQELRDAVHSKKVKEIRKGNIVRLEVIKE